MSENRRGGFFDTLYNCMYTQRHAVFFTLTCHALVGNFLNHRCSFHNVCLIYYLFGVLEMWLVDL